VVNRNINFTNVCYVGCRFCAFAQRERDADAYRLSMDQVADRAEEAWQDGATEVCMQGGIDPSCPPPPTPDLVRAVKKREHGMHVHAFSPMEIVTRRGAKAGVSVREFLTSCATPGLDTIPGTAARTSTTTCGGSSPRCKLQAAAAWVEGRHDRATNSASGPVPP
jgi:FO synthase